MLGREMGGLAEQIGLVSGGRRFAWAIPTALIINFGSPRPSLASRSSRCSRGHCSTKTCRTRLCSGERRMYDRLAGWASRCLADVVAVATCAGIAR